jgi:hypothetical protein
LYFNVKLFTSIRKHQLFLQVKILNGFESYDFKSLIFNFKDGTVEENVPSPELYPIHHLDELEFFPGDFVQDSKGKKNYFIDFRPITIPVS